MIKYFDALTIIPLVVVIFLFITHFIDFSELAPTFLSFMFSGFVFAATSNTIAYMSVLIFAIIVLYPSFNGKFAFLFKSTAKHYAIVISSLYNSSQILVFDGRKSRLIILDSNNFYLPGDIVKID